MRAEIDTTDIVVAGGAIAAVLFLFGPTLKAKARDVLLSLGPALTDTAQQVINQTIATGGHPAAIADLSDPSLASRMSAAAVASSPAIGALWSADTAMVWMTKKAQEWADEIAAGMPSLEVLDDGTYVDPMGGVY